MKKIIVTISFLAFMGVLVFAQMTDGEIANEEFKNTLSDRKLLKALKSGGHVIYIRHGQTEKDYADQVSADVNDCSTQRVLSEEGWKQSRSIGRGFSKHRIPIGKVTTSEYCRAWKTASLAFNKYTKNSKLNFLPFEDYTEEQVSEMKKNVMPFLVEVPNKRTNNVIVGHDDIFESATGIYPDPQGLAYVLKPNGSNFTIIAKLLPEEWEKL